MRTSTAVPLTSTTQPVGSDECEINFYAIGRAEAGDLRLWIQRLEPRGRLALVEFAGYNLYFAGQVIQSSDQEMVTDRLGSVRKRGG